MEILKRGLIKERVIKLLKRYKKLRDNQNQLVVTYYSEYADGTEFSQWFVENKHITQSIERQSRLLQRKFENLRGKYWGARKMKELQVRKLAIEDKL